MVGLLVVELLWNFLLIKYTELLMLAFDLVLKRRNVCVVDGRASLEFSSNKMVDVGFGLVLKRRHTRVLNSRAPPEFFPHKIT
jgi:hypothetical protein